MNSEMNRIMISRIHYITTKFKTKIDVIPQHPFNRDTLFSNQRRDIPPSEGTIYFYKKKD